MKFKCTNQSRVQNMKLSVTYDSARKIDYYVIENSISESTNSKKIFSNCENSNTELDEIICFNVFNAFCFFVFHSSSKYKEFSSMGP